MEAGISQELASNFHNARVLVGKCPRCRLQASTPLIPANKRVLNVEVMHPIPESISGCNGAIMSADVVAHIEGGETMYVFMQNGTAPSLRDRIIMRSLGPHVVQCQGIKMEGMSKIPMINVGIEEGKVCQSCMAMELRAQEEKRDRETDARIKEEAIMSRMAKAATRLWNTHRPDGI